MITLTIAIRAGVVKKAGHTYINFRPRQNRFFRKIFICKKMRYAPFEGRVTKIQNL